MINALVVGDVWLAPSLRPYKHALDSALDMVVGKEPLDIFLCNLEAPVKNNSPREGRRSILETDSNLLSSLQIARHNILVLANNHVTDFGLDGLLKTIERCRIEGFEISGAGENLNVARKPLILNIGTRIIAILSYSETSPHVGAIAATDHSPGVAPLDLQMILEDIQGVKAEATDIWLSLHWGKEFIRLPTPEQKGLAYKLVQAGATAIFGHHPHVLHGSERVHNTEVFYSLGNFIFPNITLRDNSLLKWGRESRDSTALQLKFSAEKWRSTKLFLKNNSLGIPYPDNDSNRSVKDKNLSTLLKSPNYEKDYRRLFFIEKTWGLAKRLINIKRLSKDLLWRYQNMNRAPDSVQE